MLKNLLLTAIFFPAIIGTAQAQIYTTTPMETTEPEPYCREYTQTLDIGGTTQKGYGTACQQPDGSWELQPSNTQDNSSTQVQTTTTPVAPPPNITYVIRDDRLYYMPPSTFVVYDTRNGRKYPHHNPYWNNRRDRDNDHRDHGRNRDDNNRRDNDRKNNENYGNNNPNRR